MVKETTSRQLNNSGFSLLEVLIAVTILAVVSIPVLHAFVTAANTTGRSTSKMYATNVAENIMEDIKTMEVKDVLKKYSLSDVEPDENGKYSFFVEIDDSTQGIDDDVRNILASQDAGGKGYKAYIHLDPSKYKNSNSVNMANLDAVSDTTAAIFCMSEDLEDKVYNQYSKYNDQYRAIYPDAPTKTKADFAGILKREIRVDIKTNGSFVDSDGKEIDKVTVNVTVSYLLTSDVNDPKCVANEFITYQAVNRQIFNNSASQKPLESIFIMFNPMYGSAKNDGDILIVHNPNDVKANLYVVAQNAKGNSWEQYRSLSKAGLNLQIYENEITDAETGKNKQPLTLRTNLFDEKKFEYSKQSDSKQVPLQCYLAVGKPSADPEGIKDNFSEQVWKRIVNKKGKFGDSNAEIAKSLNAQTLDGRTLDASTIADRIFDVTVVAGKAIDVDNWKYKFFNEDEKVVASDAWPVLVELKGTKLE